MSSATSSPKYLIDTNVFVGAEDAKKIEPEIASLIALAARHGVGIYVHQAAKDDIEQDSDEIRRATSLSKVEKYPAIALGRSVDEATLAATYGELRKRNDVVDATLLHALDAGAADILVTQDRKLRARARRNAPHLADRVLFVADAVALLRRTYEPTAVPVRHVDEVFAYTIPKNDEIFDSLREGYPGFDAWWEKCCRNHCKCWVVYDDNVLAGLVVRKDEGADDTDARISAAKILKICTFKVRPERRGTKLGELMLRQVLWYAASNAYDLTYVTTFPEQEALIELLEDFGFKRTHEKDDGELIYEKPLLRTAPDTDKGSDLYELARLSYPMFHRGKHVVGYTVPIQPIWHDMLFPDLEQSAQGSLFALDGMTPGPRRPGNTIRKVYVSRTPKASIEPGAVLVFYKGASDSPPAQAITAVGVAQGLRLARSTTEVLRLAGGRSVYTELQLDQMNATPEKPVKVVDFLLVGYVAPPFELPDLRLEGVFSHPPQSFARLAPEKLNVILDRLALTLAA